MIFKQKNNQNNDNQNDDNQNDANQNDDDENNNLQKIDHILYLDIVDVDWVKQDRNNIELYGNLLRFYGVPKPKWMTRISSIFFFYIPTFYQIIILFF